MKRFFAFGCSYTNYAWPTWANLLSTNYDEFYNWGLAGLGNRAIAERVAEANVKHQFTKDDLIIVQWSSHLRNDWWHKYSCSDRPYQWKTGGSIFNYINEKIYDDKWVEMFFYEPAYFMHTLNHILLTQGLLKSVGCEWYMTSMGDIRNLGADLRNHADYGELGHIPTPGDVNVDMLAWKKIPELAIYNKSIWEDNQDHWLMPMETHAQLHNEHTYKYIDDGRGGTKQFTDDFHPTPRQHALWIESQLADRLNLSKETMDFAYSVAERVDDHFNKFKFSKMQFTEKLFSRDFFDKKYEKMQWPTLLMGF